MLIRDNINGIKHFVEKELPFGVDTICGKELINGEFIKVDGEYTKCTCEKCFDEIDKDLRSKPEKQKLTKSNTNFSI